MSLAKLALPLVFCLLAASIGSFSNELPMFPVLSVVAVVPDTILPSRLFERGLLFLFYFRYSSLNRAASHTNLAPDLGEVIRWVLRYILTSKGRLRLLYRTLYR